MPAEPVPRQVGRYEILGAIGRGGMGIVYRARTRGPADATRISALKVIHEHLSVDQHFVLMFLDEMRIAMGLTHRNVVQTYDAGHEDDRYFMVMELVEGWSLAELLVRLKAPLPLDLALFVGMEIASALDYAHTLDPAVIHRDVSPSNILISSRGDVKLTDFGVAKAAHRLAVTSADVLKGKLGYMAPEQARGQATSASDLFSLGAVLYEALSGLRIRRGGDLESVRLGSIQPLQKVARGELPEGLVRLVTACLSPTLSARPTSAAALREGLLREHFAIQSASGQPLDSHRRLATFLSERMERPGSAAAALPARDREHPLARAILEQVEGEADGGGSMTEPPLTAPLGPGAGPEPLVVSGAGPRDETIGDPTTADDARTTPAAAAAPTLILAAPARPRPRRIGAAALAVAALLVLVGAGLAVGVWVRGEGGALQAASDARAAVAAPPDRALPVDQRPAPVPDLGDARAHRADLTRPDGGRPSAQEDRRPSSLWILARIAGRVVWADLYVDGKLAGQSPLRIPRLAPGSHLIEARREGYTAAARRARLRPGQELKVFLDLTPR